MPYNGDAYSELFCNIGGDETIDLGQGDRPVWSNNVAMFRYTPPGWAGFSQAQDRGWTPMFWADIALEHEASLDQLPREAVALAWGYEADAAMRIGRASLLIGAGGCVLVRRHGSFGGRKDARRGSVVLHYVPLRRSIKLKVFNDRMGDAGHRRSGQLHG